MKFAGLEFQDEILQPQKIKKRILSVLYGDQNCTRFCVNLKNDGIISKRTFKKTFSAEETKKIFDNLGTIYLKDVQEKISLIHSLYFKERKRQKKIKRERRKKEKNVQEE